MATQFCIADRPSEAILATFGEVTETNDRIATVEVRPGMRLGQQYAVAVRQWGTAGWSIFEGVPCHFTSREAAEQFASTWVETGKEVAR